MKTSLHKTIWFKIISIAVVGTFVFQTSAIALEYRYQDVLPKDDFKESAIGFAVTVAMPFVPVPAGEALGGALGFAANSAATGVLTVGIGAGLGATPGLVSGNDTSAWIGGIGGGLSAYSGFSARVDAIKEARMFSELANNPAARENIVKAEEFLKQGKFGEFRNTILDVAYESASPELTQRCISLANQADSLTTTTNTVAGRLGELSTSASLANAPIDVQLGVIHTNELLELGHTAEGLNELQYTLNLANTSNLGSLTKQLTNISNPLTSSISTASANLGNLSLIAGAGNEANVILRNISGLIKGGHISKAADQLRYLGDFVGKSTNQGMYFHGLGNAINPSMQQYATNLTMALTTQQASTTLAKAGTLCWGMKPEWAQFTGMVGGSTVGWSMAGMTDAGQGIMRGMYKDIHPTLAKWASPKATTWQNIKVGAITGLGQGSIQAGINIGLDKALDGKMPDSARMQIASLGGQALGSMAWGGIVGGLGESAVKAERFNNVINSADPTNFPIVNVDPNDGSVTYEQPNSVAFGNIIDSADPAYFPAINVNPKTGSVTYGDDNGVWKGIMSVAGNEQFQRSLIQQGLSIGISWAAEDSGMKPEYASTLGSSGSMLLANLPIWPQGPKPDEAARLREKAGKLKAPAEFFQTEGLDAEATRYDTLATRWNKEADRIEEFHFDSLREATAITSNKTLDMFLEPLAYGLTALAVDNLRKDKTGVGLIAHDLATMNTVAMVHSGLVVALNKQGWDEFEQINKSKMYNFYSDLFSFGTRAFGAITTGRPEESVGRSNIYGAAQRNSQLWSFSGLSSFAVYADRFQKQGGDWRLQMALRMPSSPFAATADTISNPSGGLARYHTIRNMEAMPYTVIKNVAPYTLERISPILYTRLQTQDQKGLDKANRWLKESHYPAYFDAKGLHFPGWIIADDPRTGVLMLENTFTEAKYPLTPETSSKVLTELNVNRPFEYRAPGTFTPSLEPKVTPLSRTTTGIDLTPATKSYWETVVDEIRDNQMPLLRDRLQLEPENSAYLQEQLKDAELRLIQAQQELQKAQGIMDDKNR